VTEDVDGARFFLNKKAAYKLSFPRHGPVYTFVAVIIEPKETAAPSEKSDQSLKWPDWSSFQLLNGARGDARMRRVYIACKTRSIGMYSLEDAAGDQGIQLVEANPGSVASGILREVC
jgi:hypothetical protein